MRHFSKQDYAVSQWSGGTTTQIAIYPPDVPYADRSFLWRLSSATVDLEESDFTPLGDYQRWITVLDGSMTLTHDGGSPIELTVGKVHEFDGGSQTHSVGRCTDFNLMLRKGKCRGALRTLHLSAGSSREIAPKVSGSDSSTLVVFCRSGSGIVSAEGEDLAIAPHESVLAEDAASKTITLTAEQDALFILAEIHG